MDPAAEQIKSADEPGVESKRRGLFGGLKAELGGPPRRGLRSGVGFALSSALVGSAVIAYLVTGDELQLPLIAVLAGQWFMLLAEVLPERWARAAPALRVLCLGLFVSAGWGFWLA